MTGINPITGVAEDPKKPTTINPITGMPEARKSASLITGNQLAREAASGGYDDPTDSNTVNLSRNEADTSGLRTRGATKDDIIENRATSQDTSEKWFNGLSKAGITFGGALLENTVGISAGLLSVAQGGQFFDTEVGALIDSWNKQAQQTFPNYYTKEEESKINLWSANFWADKAANGFAYSLASIASAFFAPVAPIAGLTKAMQMVNSANRIKKVKNASDSIGKAAQMGTKNLDDVANVIQDGVHVGSSLSTSAYNAGIMGERLLQSALAESSVEARENKNAFIEDQRQLALEDKIKKHLEVNPEATDDELNQIMLSGEEADNIEKYAEFSGLSNFITNAAVVGGTNMLMFGRLLRGKSMNSIKNLDVKGKIKHDFKANKFVDARTSAEKVISKATGKDKLKGWEKLYGVAEGAATEAFQEGVQFTSNKAYGDFFAKKMQDPSNIGFADLQESWGKATMETLTSKDGIESMLIGAIVGSGMSSIRSLAELKKKEVKENFESDRIDKGIEFLQKHFADLKTDVRLGETLGFAAAGMAYKDDMQAAAKNNDPIGYAMAYNGATDAVVQQAIHNGTLDSVIDKYESAATMSDADFATFFGFSSIEEMGGMNKQELVDEVVKDLKDKNDLFDSIENRFANVQSDNTFVDYIVKKVNPKFYKDYQIQEMTNNFRKQHLFTALSNRDKIKKERVKLSEQLKKFQEESGIDLNAAYEGKKPVSTLGVKGEVKRGDIDQITDAVMNGNLGGVLKNFFSEKRLSELKKNSPEAYRSLVNAYNLTKEGNNSNDINVEELSEMFNDIKLDSQFSDAIIGMGAMSAIDRMQVMPIVSKFLQLAALEAEAEFDFGIMSNDSVQKSFMAEHIKNREKQIADYQGKLFDPRNISEIITNSGLSPEAFEGISDEIVEIDPTWDSAKIDATFRSNIAALKKSIIIAQKLPDSNTAKAALIKKLSEDLKKQEAAYSAWKKTNNKTEFDNSGRIVIETSTYFNNVTKLPEISEVDLNLLALGDLSAQEIEAGLEIRLEEWKNSHGPSGPSPKNPVVVGNVVLNFGSNVNKDYGVYIYHNGKLLGGVPDPRSITIGGQPFDINNLSHVYALNYEFVDPNTNQLTIEGVKFVHNVKTMNELLSPLKKLGDSVGSAHIIKNIKYTETLLANSYEYQRNQISKKILDNWLQERFDAHKFDLEYNDLGETLFLKDVIIFKDERSKTEKYFARYKDGRTELLVNDQITAVKAIEKKITERSGTLNNSRRLIIKHRNRFQYVGLHNQKADVENDSEVAKELFNGFLTNFNKIEKATDAELKQEWENKKETKFFDAFPLLDETNEAWLTSTSINSPKIYFGFTDFRSNQLAIKIDTNTYFVNLKIYKSKDGKSFFTYFNSESIVDGKVVKDKSTPITNLSELIKVMNKRIQEATKDSSYTDKEGKLIKKEGKPDLISVKVLGVSIQKIDDSFGNETLAADPSITPRLKPRVDIAESKSTSKQDGQEGSPAKSVGLTPEQSSEIFNNLVAEIRNALEKGVTAQHAKNLVSDLFSDTFNNTLSEEDKAKARKLIVDMQEDPEFSFFLSPNLALGRDFIFEDGSDSPVKAAVVTTESELDRINREEQEELAENSNIVLGKAVSNASSEGTFKGQTSEKIREIALKYLSSISKKIEGYFKGEKIEGINSASDLIMLFLANPVLRFLGNNTLNTIRTFLENKEKGIETRTIEEVFLNKKTNEEIKAKYQAKRDALKQQQKEADVAIPVSEVDTKLDLASQLASLFESKGKSTVSESIVPKTKLDIEKYLDDNTKNYLLDLLGGNYITVLQGLVDEVMLDSAAIDNITDELLAQLISDIINETNNSPFKIAEIAKNSVDLEIATNNIKAILGDSISVQGIKGLAQRLGMQTNVSVSRFINGVIQLDEFSEPGVEYHEAFHAVFRTFLGDAAINRILLSAKSKYGQVTKEQLNTLKNEVITRANLSDKQLEALWYEEKLADDFQKYMHDKKAAPTGIIAKLFAALKKFVQRVMGKQDRLQALFEDIAEGKYKNASPAFPVYTEDSPEAYKILYGYSELDNSTLRPVNRTQTDRIVADIADKVYESVKKSKYNFGLSFAAALDQVKEYYNVNNWQQELTNLIENNEYSESKKKEIINRLLTISNLFAVDNKKLNQNLEILKQEVKNLINFKARSIEDFFQQEDNESEEDKVSRESWQTEAFENIGADRFSGKMRAIISFAQSPIDEFGFGKIIDLNNAKYTRPLFVANVYSGIIKSLSNTMKKNMLPKYRLYVMNTANTESKNFYDYLTNVVADEINEVAKKSKSKLNVDSTTLYLESFETLTLSNTYNMFISGAQGTSLTFKDVVRDARSNKHKVIESNNKQVGKEQYHKWRDNFNANTLSSDEALQALTDIDNIYKVEARNLLFAALNDRTERLNVDTIVKDIQKLYYKLGIELSTLYIKYSLLKDNSNNITDIADKMNNPNSNLEYLEWVGLIKNYSNIPTIGEIFTHKDVNPLKYAITKTLDRPQLFYLENFDNAELSDEDKKALDDLKEKTSTNRLYELANSNAIFDETLIPSTFRNMKGNLVQTETYSFFLAEQMANLRQGELHVLLSDFKVLANSYDSVSDIPADILTEIKEKMVQVYNGLGVSFPDEIFVDLSLNAIMFNPLLQTLTIEEFLDTIKASRLEAVGGARNDVLIEEEDSNNNKFLKSLKKKSEGKDYSDLSPRDKAIYLMVSYLNSKQRVVGNKIKQFSNVLLAVNSDKKRQFLVNTATTTMFAKSKLTEEGLALMTAIFKGEVDIIKNFNPVHNRDISQLKLFNTTEESDIELKKLKSMNFNRLKSSDPMVNEFFNKVIDHLIEDPSNSFTTLMSVASNQNELTQVLNIIAKEKASDYESRLREDKIGLVYDIVDSEGKKTLINQAPGLPSEFITSNGTLNNTELTNYVLNDWVNSLSYHTLINHHSSLVSVKDVIDTAKRESLSAASGPDMGSGTTMVNIVADEIINIESTETDRHGVTSDKDGTNTTDGISYVTPDWFISTYLRSQGLREPQVLDIYRRVIRRGITPNERELDILYASSADMQTLKLQINDAYSAGKMSTFILNRELTSIRNNPVELDKIFDLIDELEDSLLPTIDYNGIPVTKAELIIKTHKFFTPKEGREKLHNLLNSKESNNEEFTMTVSAAKKILPRLGTLDGISNMRFAISNTSIRKQVETSGFKDSIVHGTQLMQHIITEIADKIMYFDGISTNGSILKDAYKKMMSFRIEKGMIQKRRELVLEALGNDRAKYKFLIKSIQNSLEASNSLPYIMEMFSSDDTGLNFKYDINFPTIESKSEAMFLSMISMGSLKQKVAGTKFVLTPDYGFTIKDEETGLQRRLKHRLGDNKTGYFSEAIVSEAFAKTFGLKIGDTIPERALKFLGVRIPTQDKHSMVTVKIAGYAPAINGNMIVLPIELIELAGADFDIDALFAHTYSLFTSNNSEIIIYGDYTRTKGLSDLEIIKQAKVEYYNHMISENPIVKEGLRKKGINKIKHHKFSAEEKDELDAVILINNLETFNSKQVVANAKAYQKGKFNEVIPQNIEEANNIMLELQMAMLNNDYNKEIYATKATRDLFKNRLEFYKAKGIINDNQFNEAFSLFNKLSIDEANSIGQNNIGTAAKFSTTFSYVAGKKFKKNAEGISKYFLFGEDGFNTTLDDNNGILNDEGTRVLLIADQIVTAMTDAAKHMDPGYFNIDPESLGVMQMAISVGKSFNFAVDLINQRAVIKYNAIQQRIKSPLSNEQYKDSETIKEIVFKSLQLDSTDSITLSEELLEAALIYSTNPEDSGITEEIYKQIQVASLNDYIEASNIANSMVDLGRVTALLKGSASNFSDNYLVEKAIERILNDEFPINMDEVLQENPQLKALMTALSDINDIASLFFTLETPTAKVLLNSVISKLNNRSFNFSDNISQVRKHLLSFLNSKAMRHNKEATKGLDLLFTEDLHKKIREVRRMPQFKDNLFLNYLKLSKINYDNGAFAGTTLYNITTDTISQKEGASIDKIMDHFKQLMYATETKEMAEDMIEYLLIRDAFIFKNGTFATQIEPQFLEMSGLFAISKRILNKMSGSRNVESYEQLFGVSSKGLMYEFISLYTRYTGNSNQVRKTTLKKLLSEELTGITSSENNGEKIIIDIANRDRNAKDIKEKASKLVKAMEKSGIFGKNAKGLITFPFSFKITNDNNIYVLSEITHKDSRGKIVKTDLAQMTTFNEDIFNEEGDILAYKAVYRATSHIGSKTMLPYYLNTLEWNSIVAKGLAGKFPKYKSAPKVKKITPKVEDMEPAGSSMEDILLGIENQKETKPEVKPKEETPKKATDDNSLDVQSLVDNFLSKTTSLFKISLMVSDISDAQIKQKLDTKKAELIEFLTKEQSKGVINLNNPQDLLDSVVLFIQCK